VIDAFERGLELPDPLLNGDIEGGERARGDCSRGRKAMAHLEALDRLGDTLVKRSRCLVGSKIVAEHQTLAQQIIVRAGGAEREFGFRRDHRPAAADRQIRIAQRGLLDPLCGAFVEGRLVR
jgi:hypothetical protein